MWVCPNDRGHQEFVEIRTRTVAVQVDSQGETVLDLRQHYEEAVDVPACKECSAPAEYEEDRT